jgi:hypothetical protein
VLIGTSSLPVVEVLFRYSATGAENVPADVLDAVTALGRSFA